MTIYCLIIDHNFCDENGILIEKTYFTEIIKDSYANNLFESIIAETDIIDSFSDLSISISVVKLLLPRKKLL